MTALAVACLSAGILAYEVLLTRLFAVVQWHSFAFMIISVALLGFAASGTFVTFLRERLLRRFNAAFAAGAMLFAVTAPAAFVFAQQVPFNPLELIWDWRQIPLLLTVYALLTVPFFFGGTCIALALSRPASPIARIYAFDLVGAGAGACGVVLALSFLHPLTCLMLVACFGFLAAACMAFDAGARLATGLLVLVAAAIAATSSGRLAFAVSPYKGLSMALRVPDARILAEASSPLGWVTVVESSRIPFRYAPGLSLNATTEPPPQLGLFVDADAMSAITAFAGDTGPLQYLDFTMAALPYHLLRRPNVLVLGAGGGAGILLARYHGAPRIDAVELNPATVRLVDRTFGDFSGRVYTQPPGTAHVGDARSFAAASEARYDLVELPAGGAVGHGLGESYGDTVEAFATYFRRLAPGGFLSATRAVDLPPRAGLKLLATAALALEKEGVTEPGKRMAMIRGWQTLTLIVKQGELSTADIAGIREFAAGRSFDLVHLPGMSADESNRFNRLEEDVFFAGAQALLGPGREDFIARYKFDIRPASDDRPYFDDFFRWRALPEILALRAQGGAGLLEWGSLILLATLIQALLLGAGLILLPFAGRDARIAPGVGAIAVYFSAVGLAFLFLEIAFLQRLTLFLGNPLYAIAVVLAGFLAWAGVGSALAPRLARRLRQPVRTAVAAIVVTSVAYLLALPSLLESLIALPDALKIAVALLLIAPLAVPMGMPFPLGLTRLHPQQVAWAWAINGSASVVSAVLATILARELGFSAVVVAATALYVLAAASAPRLPGSPQ